MANASEAIEVMLTWPEMLLAAHVGCMRNVQSLKLGRKSRDGGQRMDQLWSANIDGAAGEMAVAKYLELFWSGNVGDIEANDVGPYEVKTNGSRRLDDCIIRPWNDPNKIYIGVLSFVPQFIITGWIVGTDGMKEEYLRDGLPGMTGYFVPRAILHPIKTLPTVEMAEAGNFAPLARAPLETVSHDHH